MIRFFDAMNELGQDLIEDVAFTNGEQLVSFDFDTSLMVSTLGQFITRVEISALDDSDVEGFEWDFLLDSATLDQATSPVPLFISALLGGLVTARLRKPSDSIN